MVPPKIYDTAETVPVIKGDYKTEFDPSKHDEANKVLISMKRFLEAKGIYDDAYVKRARQGDWQYRYSSYKWKVTTYSSGVLSSTHKLNKVVSNPPGPAPSAGNNMKWVCCDCKCSKKSGSENWTNEVTYETKLTTTIPDSGDSSDEGGD